jgi:hypothetical protein
MGRRRLPLILIISMLLASPWASADTDFSAESADTASSEVASKWFELLYDVVKAERLPPTAASRIYGITAVALYESVVAGSNTNRSLVGQLNGLTFAVEPNKNEEKYDWPVSANAAIADTIRGLFPTISAASLNSINSLEEQLESQFRQAAGRRKFKRSRSFGRAVAAVILQWASGDGLSTLNNCPYVPEQVAGAWRPTPPAFAPNPLQPCWGQLRTMVLTSGRECPSPPPPEFSTDPASSFFAAANEVYTVGVSLTALQKTIADYWADNAAVSGTPPGHWIAIVSQISRNDSLSLTRSAEAYARVGIAVHDAFIVCWNQKYVFNLQRPVTYINDNIDASWLPYIATPGFPTYTSGHSTQSGAAATVLTDMFGTKRFTDTTHTDHGLTPAQSPRTFNSFNEAAAEAAISRLFGGIHFTFDNNEGLACGQCIGRAINDRVSFQAE